MKYLDKYSKVLNEMICSTTNVIDSKNFVSQLYFSDRKTEVSEFIVKQILAGNFQMLYNNKSWFCTIEIRKMNLVKNWYFTYFPMLALISIRPWSKK